MAGHVLRLLRPPRRPAPLLRARRASGRTDPRLPRRRPSRAPAHSRVGPPSAYRPVQEQAAARALLLSEPPVAAARPRALQATAAAQRAAGRPGLGCPLLQAWLGQAFHIFWTGLQPKSPPQPPRSASNEEDDLITSLPLVR